MKTRKPDVVKATNEGIWRKLIDWSDKNATAGELIRDVTDRFTETKP